MIHSRNHAMMGHVKEWMICSILAINQNSHLDASITSDSAYFKVEDIGFGTYTFSTVV